MSQQESIRFRALALTVMALALGSVLASRHPPTSSGFWRGLAAWLALWLTSLFAMRSARLHRVAVVAFIIAGGALARLNANLSSSLLLGLGVLGAHLERPWFWYIGALAAVGAVVWLGGPHLATTPPDAWLNLLVTLALVLLLGRLYEDARQQRNEQERALAELRTVHAQLARHSLEVEELAALRERTRMARELHDTLGHALSAITVELEAARRLARSDPARMQRALTDTQALARDAMRELRGYVEGLRSDTQVVEPEVVARVARETAERNGWRLDFAVDGDIRALSGAWLQILREALTNTERHARARAVMVHLWREGEALVLSVTDDGRGFDPGAIEPGHFGIRGMRERAEAMGGTLAVESRPGHGTRLVARVSDDASAQERG